MAAGLYATKDPGRYYHIHGSLDATTTLNMLGLDSYRPDLRTHEDISNTIERAVMDFTVAQLEDLNNSNKQAGVEALKYEDFLQTPHVSSPFLNKQLRRPITDNYTGASQ